MPTLAERYIQLAHGIQEYFPGYIDAYFGPDELKQVEKVPIAVLLKTANALHEDAKDASGWFQAQVTSMQTVLAKLSGQAISYLEEVKQVYDIEPKHVSEELFEKAYATLDTLLEGSGSLLERLESFRERFIVPPETLPQVIEYISTELRQRTKKLFTLPDEETFTIELVKDKPWGGYNWYEGRYRSRIDINMDLPKHLYGLPHLLAHEGYPGHHTEHVLKEQHLYKEQGKLEHTIFLINSPEAVQAEGIAENALAQAMTEDEVTELLIDLLPLSNVQASKEDIKRTPDILNALEHLSYVSGNAALLLHEEKASSKDVLAYLQRYSLNSPVRNKKLLEFLQAPTSASYVFTYTIGKDLVAQVLKTGDARETFKQLLRGAYTPRMMREWIYTSQK
jgi:hypothetical protein